MITITIECLTDTGQVRHFMFSADLEVAFDQLNYFLSQEDQVLSAHLLDQKQRLELPLEAFDGQAFELPLASLKQQWEAVLRGPVRAHPE